MVRMEQLRITMTAIRKVYWIPTIRQRIRSILRRFVIFAKEMEKPYKAPDYLHYLRALLDQPHPLLS